MSTQPTSAQIGPRVFVAILVLGIAILWFRRDPHPPKDLQQSPSTTESQGTTPSPELTDSKPSSAASNPPALATNPNAMLQAKLPPDNFAEEFRRCFPERARSNSMQDFVRDLVVSPDLLSRDLSSENVHIQEAGSERRLNIFENGPMYDVREFDVDREGLPIPKDEPQTMSRAEAEAFKEDFLRRGNTTYQQRKETIMLNDGLRGELEWQDDKIHDLMLFRADRSFFCRDGQCQCKSQGSEAN